jgi:hypothetical protein
MDSPKPFSISKREVWEAYKRVRANQGAAGVDEQSIAEFEEDLANNLYKLWNRLASGSYFPPPVRRVEIPKDKGVRALGIPTVSDRIAQMVVKRYRLERSLSPGAFNKMCQAYEYADLSADLPRLGAVPVLLLAGLEGSLGLRVPLVQHLTEQFRDGVPHAQTREIAGAGGTYCMLEKPEETAQAAIQYLSSLAR